MQTVLNYIKTNPWKVATFVFAFLFLSKGCINSKISKLEEKTVALEKKIDSLEAGLSSVPTKKEVRNEMELVMFDYLIYEEDLDKGKTSLSEIKNKIEAND